MSSSIVYSQYPIYHQDSSVTFSATQVNFLRNVYLKSEFNLIKFETAIDLIDKKNDGCGILLSQLKLKDTIIKNLRNKVSNLEMIIENKYVLRGVYDGYVKVSSEESEKLNKQLKRSRLVNWGFGVGGVLVVVLVLVLG